MLKDKDGLKRHTQIFVFNLETHLHIVTLQNNCMFLG